MVIYGANSTLILISILPSPIFPVPCTGPGAQQLLTQRPAQSTLSEAATGKGGAS